MSAQFSGHPYADAVWAIFPRRNCAGRSCLGLAFCRHGSSRTPDRRSAGRGTQLWALQSSPAPSLSFLLCLLK